ncbi:hypothetical protein [Microbacterium sp. 2FI]|uniref:hypothetical protein n=1 Tax=Microbacterium sp. 2FI TaxID=2502193 RepID=UPI0010F9B3AE|nr:hypothetical protein [Microbacterium sp. 2FI]
MRKPAARNTYRTGFLHSRAWFARRDRWFREEVERHGQLRCEACLQVATNRQLELHHLDYSGVASVDGRWQAREPHEDLVALHPFCHELLHRLLDRDIVLSRHRSRRNGSLFAINRLQHKLASRSEDHA